MYPISEEAKKFFVDQKRQVCDIEAELTSGSTITLNESVLKSMRITRQSTTESNIYIGATISNQLEFTLMNDGTYSDYVFEGAEMFVNLGVIDVDNTYYIPMGYFTVDEPTRPLSEINIVALDRMMLFSKYVGDEFYTWFPCTVSTLLTNICSSCNVTLGTNVSSFPNATYVINEAPEEENLTYRQVLSWLCEIMGKNAYFNHYGNLIIDFYHSSEDFEIDESLRFTSDIMENPITISGVKVVTDESEYLAGTEDYCFVLEDNLLIQNGFESIATNIYNNVQITYLPFACSTLPLPFLYPMDYITFTEGEESYTCYLTGICFEMNGVCELVGVGESEKEQSYAEQNPLTSRERVIINKAKAEINETLNRRIQSVLELNDLITNTMGFWSTSETLADGSTIRYIHDQPNLGESKSVWRMNGQTFSWTDDYDGEQTVWQNGISSSGNAWFRYISAIGLTLADANNEWNSEFTPSAWFIKKGEMYAMLVDTTTGEVQMRIPKLVIDNPSTNEKDGYLEIGKIRFQPVNVSGECVGTGIIQVD